MRKVRFYSIFCLIIALEVLAASLSYASDGEGETDDAESWLDRITFGADAGTDITPRVYFETVQPLYQDHDKESTFFIQPRYAYDGADKSYNLGFGYRRLTNNNTILLGANTFFDYEDNYKHYRAGFGLEAFINQVELRGNSYIGLSPRRLIYEAGSTKEYEKAVDGFDLEFGLPIPHMNWISLYGSGYWYNYELFDNKTGWKIRGQLEPLKDTIINLIVWDDDKGDTEFRVDARIGLPWGYFTGRKKGSLWNAVFSKEAYPEKIDHSRKTLDRVEREYRIEVERWTDVAGAIVEVKRGN